MNKLEKAKEELQKYVGEEVEVIAMTKEDFNRHIENVNQENMKLKDKVEQLQDRIDKARIYIKEHSTTIDYKTMRADYNLNMNDLLDILQGDNK